MAGAEVEEITFDCVRVETHDSTSQVTSHPTEAGDVADHVIVDPDKVTIEAIFSNGPLVAADAEGPRYRVVQQGAGKTLERVGVTGTVEPQRAESNFDFIYQAQQRGLTFTLSTTLRDYDNLAIERITVPRDASHGDAVHATIGFKRIRTADVVRGELPPPRESPARKSVNRGKKADKAASTKQTEDSSILGSIFY